jgi:hypothetical protein
MRWDDSMRNFKAQLQRGQTFRHGITMVPTSGIAQQFYCEQKVEMEYLHGEIETEAKTEGERLHEKLTKVRAVAHSIGRRRESPSSEDCQGEGKAGYAGRTP